MPSIARIDSIIQRGRGKEAKVFGQTFDVYRLKPTSNSFGIVGPGSLIASKIRCQFDRLTAKADLEIELPGKVLHYTAAIDMRPFREGDVFVQREDSYKYENLVFTCVSNRPAPLHPVFAATPIYGTLSRAKPNANNIDSGRAPYNAPIKAFELILTLAGHTLNLSRPERP